MAGSMLKTRMWIAGAIIIAAFALYFLKPYALQQIEFKCIDAKFRIRGPLTPGDEITLIAIDRKSLDNVGKWPWDRKTFARLIRTLSAKGARLIGIDILFSFPSPDPTADLELIQAMKDAGNVVLAYYVSFLPQESTFQSRELFEKSLDLLRPFRIPVLTNISGEDIKPNLLEVLGVELNTPAITAVAAASGYYNVQLESDGFVRRIPLFVQAGNNIYQSFATAALKQYYNAKNPRVILVGKHALYLEVGPLKIPTDGMGQMFINYYGPPRTFKSIPAWKILAGDVPENLIRDKAVLIGGTSSGDFETRLTPFHAALPSVELQATCVDNMMRARYLIESTEGATITAFCIIALPLLMALSFPRSGRSLLGLGIALLFIAIFLASNQYLFSVHSIQSNTIYPLLAVFSSYFALSIHTGVVHERRAKKLRRSVSEMSAAISSVLDINELCPAILESMISAVGADRGALFTCGDSEEGIHELRIECAVRMPVALMDSGHFDYGKEIISRVAAERHPLVINHLPKGKSPASLEGDHSVRPRSIFCLPLAHRKTQMMIIYMERDHPGYHFWDEDIKVIDSFATQAAIALENAAIYSKLRQEDEHLRTENLYLKKEVRAVQQRSRYILGNSPTLHKVLDLIDKAAASTIAVLIEGETGTGKELIAKEIHFKGPRKDDMFVAQNCSALAESLLESELFGHKRGAFTGAVQDKKGLFEIADGGTIFLDEVADMTPSLQAKLLRVLQEGVMRPLGSVQEKKVDLRIISATNKDLATEVKEGRFREDLYYRLNAFTIHVPPLRERKEDIPLLAAHFLETMSKQQKKNIKGISREVMGRLMAYRFPGNVRELENEIEKAVVMAADGEMLTSKDLSPKMSGEEGAQLLEKISGENLNLKETVRVLEKEMIIKALAKWNGNQTKAADELGVSRKGLARMLTRLGIEL